MTTSGVMHGRRILNALERRGITPLCVLLVEGISLRECLPREGGAVARARGLPAGVARWALRNVRARRLARRITRRYRAPVVLAGEMNGTRLRGLLEELAPDVLVLGGGGILAQPILDTARLGVLNAHPGLLPWLRGSGVVGHALERGVAVGATVHRVTRLVDAGAIVQRRLLPVEGPATLAELRERTGWLAAEMMADVVARSVRTGELPAGMEQAERFPLLRWPAPGHARELDALARAGRARELFDLWAPLCDDRERWTFPNTPLAPP